MSDWEVVSEHRSQASLTYGPDKWRQTEEGEGEELQDESEADREHDVCFVQDGVGILACQ